MGLMNTIGSPTFSVYSNETRKHAIESPSMSPTVSPSAAPTRNRCQYWPRLQQSVFILFIESSSIWTPTGTAFSITNRHVIAARHCIVDLETNTFYPKFCIAQSCTSSEILGPIQMVVHSSSVENDWVILKIENDSIQDFSQSLEICSFDRLPEKGTSVRAVYAAVGMLIDGSYKELKFR